MKRDFYIVGIGSSAGGLEALQSFVKNLPDNSNMSYVVAQHLSPTYKSMLVELLQRDTNKNILEAKSGMALQADTIYICPPNRDITIKNGMIHLETIQSEFVAPKPSIDLFFSSLAHEMGDKAIGIILSGTGSDGSYGVRAIKAEGGLTIAQDPNSAKYDGMPMSAINTKNIDLILPPEQIGSELLEILECGNNFSIIKQVNLSPDYMSRLMSRLKEIKSVDFSKYKLSTINRRIERRMAALKITNLKDYVDYLETNEKEPEQLYKDILIGVTSFFRDFDAFNVIKEYLPTVMENKNRGSQIRVWSIGCSTGEEAYSIAIILSEVLGQRVSDFDIQIFATDIDDEAIGVARKGQYSLGVVSSIPKSILKKYFIQKNEQYEIIKPIRDMILFSHHDITRDPPFLKLDFISCRNLLIYFNQDLQKDIFPIFHYSLNDNGILFLGKSESPGQMQGYFAIIDNRWKVYKKEYIGDKKHIPRSIYTFQAINRLKNGDYREPPKEKPSLINIVKESISNLFLPQTIVVNELYDVIYVREQTPYLQVSVGNVTNNIFKMIHKDLSIDLRTTLSKAIKEKNIQKSQFIKIDIFGTQKIVKIIVIPIENYREATTIYIISFQEENIEDLKLFAISKKSETDERFYDIELELNRTKEHLQTVIEELETSNEELQSLNEELETTNEELQSTNEELQTAYSELKISYDTNELQKRAVEASELKFRAIFNNAGVGILILNSHGKIINANSEIINMLGYSIDDLKELDIKSITYECDLNRNLTLFKNLVDGKIDKYSIEKRYIKKDGSTVWCMVTISICNTEDKFIIKMIKDITELKAYRDELEERVKVAIEEQRVQEQLLIQQSKLATMGEMISAIAHQWRQPLNAIAIIIQCLLDEYEDKELSEESFRDSVARAMEQIEFMSKTIDDFRNFFRPNSDNEMFNVCEVIESSMSIFKAQLQNNSIEVEIDKNNCENSILIGNKNQLRQVIINLMSNSIYAIKHRKVLAGKIKIVLQNDENSLNIKIIDNGGGVDDKTLERIFEPYFTTKPQGDGTGIGLYMTKIIVERNFKGIINAQNIKDGLEIDIRIPK